jgi:lysophospholipase L1-like esterase
MATTIPTIHRETILLFGDSITELSVDHGGFSASLAYAYRRKADVITRGYSGYNTRHAIAIAPRVYSSSSSSSSFLFTTIFFGANDSSSIIPFKISDSPEHYKPSQHVPLEEFENNIIDITTHALKTTRKDGLIFVISPPPVNRKKWPDRSNLSVVQYTNAVSRAVSTSNDKRDKLITAKVVHLNLFEVMYTTNGAIVDSEEIISPYEQYLSDGLHLSIEGNKVISDCILKLINEHAKSISPESLSLDLPLWMDATIQANVIPEMTPEEAQEAYTKFAFDTLSIERMKMNPKPLPPRPILPPGLASLELQAKKKGEQD